VDVTINGQSRKAVNLFEFCITANWDSSIAYATSTNLATAFEIVNAAGNWSKGGMFKMREAHVVMADHDSPNPNLTHRAITIDTKPNNQPAYYRSNNAASGSEYGYILRSQYSLDVAYNSWFSCDGVEIPVSKAKGSPGCRIRDFDFHVYSFSNTNIVSGAGTENTDYVYVSTIGASKTGGNEIMYGGKYVCEIIYFAEPLTATERALVHDHLRRKWQGASVPAAASTLVFDEIGLAGNELDYGDSDVLTSKLSGSGTLTVNSAELAANGELDFTFTDVDQVGAIAVSGPFTLPAAFTVGIAADPATLKLLSGDYTLLTASSLIGDIDGATVVHTLAGKRFVRLVKDGNELKARVYAPGTSITFR